MKDFSNRRENNWCELCKKAVYELSEHMREHYNKPTMFREDLED